MVAEPLTEVIFVGLPGPTHHYGGLSPDNVASEFNRGSVSGPRQAALQVIGLLRLLSSLGVPAAVLPPQLRPNLALLRQHFSGDDAAVITQAGRGAQALLEKASSSSAMWTANAATVAPAIDTGDHALHLTVANLFTNLHRRIEAEDTYRTLKAIFRDVPDSIVHPPLSPAMGLSDEGAANHMRLAPAAGAKGLHVFVYGADGSGSDPKSARQTLSASRAVQLQHRLPDSETLFVRQNPEAIRAGVFHNDVIAVSHMQLLLVHEAAYAGGQEDIGRIAHAYRALHPGAEPVIITIGEDELSLDEAVHTFFFNSQIVSKADGSMELIAPAEVNLLYEAKAAALLERICADGGNPIAGVHTVDLRQSMRNGGGPACLRLRVPVTPAQLAALSSTTGVMAGPALLEVLEKMIAHYYPAELTAGELGDPKLYYRGREMIAECANLLRLPLLA